MLLRKFVYKFNAFITLNMYYLDLIFKDKVMHFISCKLMAFLREKLNKPLLRFLNLRGRVLQKSIQSVFERNKDLAE